MTTPLRRSFLPALGTAICLALPAQALDLDNMSEAEREAFRAEIRSYLLDNPQVIMEAVAVLEQRDAEAKQRLDRELVKAHADALFNDGHSWVGGNPDGDITLVEFMDYRCGYCRRAFTDVEELVDVDGNIRLILKEFPILGEDSENSARFAIATQQIVGEDAYKSVHDALMAMNGPVNDMSLTRLAEPLGIEAAPILAHMNSDEVTEVIEKNRQLASTLSISGTPSFVMNTEMLRGYLPLNGMLQLVDEIRSQ